MILETPLPGMYDWFAMAVCACFLGGAIDLCNKLRETLSSSLPYAILEGKSREFKKFVNIVQNFLTISKNTWGNLIVFGNF